VTPTPAEQTEAGTEKKTVQAEAKPVVEAPSPDGKFAFRYARESKPNPDEASDSQSKLEKQTYDLIDKRSGKVLMSVAESDPDAGPSARFVIC